MDYTFEDFTYDWDDTIDEHKFGTHIIDCPHMQCDGSGIRYLAVNNAGDEEQVYCTCMYQKENEKD